jgi:hypothetical protein
VHVSTASTLSTSGSWTSPYDVDVGAVFAVDVGQNNLITAPQQDSDKVPTSVRRMRPMAGRDCEDLRFMDGCAVECSEGYEKSWEFTSNDVLELTCYHNQLRDPAKPESAA